MSNHVLKARLHPDLCQPDFLEKLTSKQQVTFMLELAQQAFFGHVVIRIPVWAERLGVCEDSIRKSIKRFIDLGVIRPTKKKHYYEFLYYVDLVKVEKGYIKLYKFLFESFFRSCSLREMRIILYLLSI